MDPVTRVREFLLDNVGHMTHPGNPTLDGATQRWIVPIYCRTERGNLVVGDVELDRDCHIVFAPSKEEMMSRLRAETATPVPSPLAGSIPTLGEATPISA